MTKYILKRKFLKLGDSIVLLEDEKIIFVKQDPSDSDYFTIIYLSPYRGKAQ